MILLDTSILVYAVGGEHPLREPSRRILKMHAEGRIEAGTTIEVIQEFAHVRSRGRARAGAASMAREFAEALQLIPVRRSDLQLGMTLFERHPHLGAFDSTLAAVGINNRVEMLISADRAFDAVSRLRWVDPGRADLEKLIGGRERQLA
jgi:predicted nucleic acid-binding protein